MSRVEQFLTSLQAPTASVPSPKMEATATFIKRCVRAVATEGGGGREALDRAFAICTAQAQKSGKLKPGTATPTKAGVTASRSKAAQSGHSAKMADYQNLLAAARAESIAALDSIPLQEDAPTGAQPERGKPLYYDNYVAIPLDWGVPKARVAADTLLPLFHAARNGVAYVLDRAGVLAKIGWPSLTVALEQAIRDHYGEAHAMAAEGREDFGPGDPEYREVELAAARVKMARSVRVSLAAVVSPKTGRTGVRIHFAPDSEAVEAAQP